MIKFLGRTTLVLFALSIIISICSGIVGVVVSTDMGHRVSCLAASLLLSGVFLGLWWAVVYAKENCDGNC